MTKLIMFYNYKLVTYVAPVLLGILVMVKNVLNLVVILIHVGLVYHVLKMMKVQQNAMNVLLE